jgi:hypothetical protein
LPEPGQALGARDGRDAHMTRADDDGAGAAGTEEWRL